VDQRVDFSRAASQGLLADHIPAGLEDRLGDRHVEMAGRGVDHQVEIVPGDHVAPVEVGVAAELGPGVVEPLLQRVGNGGDLVPRILPEVGAMNRIAAAPLTNHPDPYRVTRFDSHVVFLPDPSAARFDVRARPPLATEKVSGTFF